MRTNDRTKSDNTRIFLIVDGWKRPVSTMSALESAGYHVSGDYAIAPWVFANVENRSYACGAGSADDTACFDYPVTLAEFLEIDRMMSEQQSINAFLSAIADKHACAGVRL